MTFRRFARCLLPIGLASAVLLACSSATPSDNGGDAGACPVATDCPSKGAPSYAATVAPIVERVCVSCHAPGGQGGFSLGTYADVFAQRSAVLDQLAACAMPPSNGPSLSGGDRETLTGWLECGAPNN